MPTMISEPDLSLPKGSHAVVSYGDEKVCIRDVEIFREHEEGKLGKVSLATLREITNATNDRMTVNQAYPQVVLTHEAGVPVVGRIPSPVSLRKNANDEWCICADIEMSRADFFGFVASNRYPRRSVEIQKDTMEITALALLGRETPALPLPDTVFAKGDGSKIVVECPLPTNFEQGTLPPTVKEATSTPEPRTMTHDELINAFATLDDASATAFAKAAKKKRPKAFEDDDDEKKKKEEEAANHSLTGNAATFAAEASSLRATNVALASQLEAEREARLTFERDTRNTMIDLTFRAELTTLKNVAGFSTIDIDEELGLLKGLPTDEARKKHLDHIRKHYARKTTGAALVNGGALPVAAFSAADTGLSTDPNAPAPMSKERMERVVAHATAAGVSFEAAMQAIKV